MTVVVGNDVVDLGEPRCRDRAGDRRFVERVFTPAERALLSAAADADRTLWWLWAAKEAAFKVVTKLRGEPPVFEHAAFRVEPGTGDAPGRVRWREHTVRVREVESPFARALHLVAEPEGQRARVRSAVAPLPEADPPLDRLPEAERSVAYSAASAWVRILAGEELLGLARESGSGDPSLDPPSLEISTVPGPPGRSPPRVRAGGRSVGWDVSLSHHGRWVAWIVAAPPGPGREAAGDQRRGR